MCLMMETPAKGQMYVKHAYSITVLSPLIETFWKVHVRSSRGKISNVFFQVKSSIGWCTTLGLA
jgi:hypothetical protein